MFNDPNTVTFSGTPIPLPRISINGQSALYKSADGRFSVTISHQSTSKKRNRRMVRFDANIPGTDPLTSDPTVRRVSAYVVIDHPDASDFNDTDIWKRQLVLDLNLFLTASSGAMLDKVLGSEI